MRKKLILVELCIILLAIFTTGCSGTDDLYTERSYTYDSSFSSITLDLYDRSVDISTSPDDKIHVTCFESSKEFYKISQDDHTLAIVSENAKDWTDYIGSKASSNYRIISLQIPDGLLDSLSISTTNEDIHIDYLSVSKDVSLNVNGGDIILEGIDCPSISLTGKNGDIDGTIVGSYDDYKISCEIKKGQSNLPACKDIGSKKLEVANNNGDIDIIICENEEQN